MKDFSNLLADRTNAILEKWIAAVRRDRQIESTDDLSYLAVRNHLPEVLKAMATVLSKDSASDVKSIVAASLEHGILRAEQGFNPTEIAREYRLLRQVIFTDLEAGLLTGTPAEVFRAFRLVDAVIDEAIARCFESYTDERLRELNQMQSQMVLNNQELTRLVRISQENLSYLAHELKNPLSSIIGYSDLFLRQHRQFSTEAKDSLTNLEHIERVLRSGRHLLRLINDALEISRYEAGEMKLYPMPIDAIAVINNVVEVMAPLADTKGLPIIVSCDRAPRQVITDSLRLQQIVTNLLSNAIRYTESGSVNITCQMLSDCQWAIAISDTGIGIAPDDQAEIFNPYFRVGASGSYLPDSTGLGLAIVSRLVKLLQGEIKLVSQPGFGSTFTVTLPLVVQLTAAVPS